ncbi:MAG: hypothetical protein SFT93_03250 [Rickettsiaceae bacterium]|nr:hypothetical protein [Rickettsiaceae bacterium]
MSNDKYKISQISSGLSSYYSNDLRGLGKNLNANFTQKTELAKVIEVLDDTSVIFVTKDGENITAKTRPSEFHKNDLVKVQRNQNGEYEILSVVSSDSKKSKMGDASETIKQNDEPIILNLNSRLLLKEGVRFLGKLILDEVDETTALYNNNIYEFLVSEVGETQAILNKKDITGTYLFAFCAHNESSNILHLHNGKIILDQNFLSIGQYLILKLLGEKSVEKRNASSLPLNIAKILGHIIENVNNLQIGQNNLHNHAHAFWLNFLKLIFSSERQMERKASYKNENIHQIKEYIRSLIDENIDLSNIDTKNSVNNIYFYLPITYNEQKTNHKVFFEKTSEDTIRLIVNIEANFLGPMQVIIDLQVKTQEVKKDNMSLAREIKARKIEIKHKISEVNILDNLKYCFENNQFFAELSSRILFTSIDEPFETEVETEANKIGGIDRRY